MNEQHRLARRNAVTAVALLSLALHAGAARALDPPHDIPSNNIACLTCHVPHGAAGATITQVAGNPNLCMSCHNPAGMASSHPFVDADQAFPGQTGDSHRWDSGVSGHVRPAAGNTSTGKVRSGGVFNGRLARTYTLTIATGGETGTATFNWSDGQGGSGSNILTGAQVTLADGLVLGFSNGTPSPSFLAGNQWMLRVQPDLRLPVFNDAADFEDEMARRLADLGARNPDRSHDTTFAKVVCSVCHDQHSQENEPFDPAAPVFAGPGTGAGRHFQRKANDANQMCFVCHSPRDVQASSGGSHPVRVTIPGGDFQTPANLPLDADNKVVCMTCHSVHFATSGGVNGGQGDGFLLRRSLGDTCYECHTLADRTNGSHFKAASGALWGGNRNRTANATQQLDAFTASSFAALSSEKRGFCVNCHWPHGWPDAVNTATDYPNLWVERYDTTRAPADAPQGSAGEALCYACHTVPVGGVPTAPATSNLEAEFQKGSPPPATLPSPDNSNIFRHPVNDNEQRNGPGGSRRVVECADCHNPHEATATDRHAGVAGTAVNNGTIPAGTRPLREFELCFNCHGGTFNATRTGPSATQPWTTDKRLDFQTTNSAYHPVVQPGRNKSANLANQLSAAGLNTNATLRCTDCHNSDAYATTTGRVVEVTATGPVGPHGSTNATILRANFNKNYTQNPGNWNNTNADLCFRCHSSAQLFGTGTGFTDRGSVGQYRRGNLHAYHLSNKGVTPSCMSCHYDIHSNRSASNTRYRWMRNGTPVNDGTGLGNGLYATPPSGLKTKLVNFAPDVSGNNAGGAPTTLPLWEIDDVTRVRKCSINCHGKNMDYDRAWYQPTSASDDPSHIYRTTTTAVVSSLNPSTTAQNVTFTATITGTSINPTGSVAFVDGPTTLCAASTISASAPFTATCTVPAGNFTAGGHGVAAIYTGDADDGASTSSVLLQTVN